MPKNAKTGPGAAAAQADTAGKAAMSSPAEGESAVDLLKADHRKVETLFQEFEQATESAEKSRIAGEVCRELTIHTTLEEEIFYPACREGAAEEDALDEAQVEHDTAKILIAEITAGSPEDEFYDAKVKVLSEYIKHHVAEEEEAGSGIFAKAEQAAIDMNALGQRLQARKAELLQQAGNSRLEPGTPRSLDVSRNFSKENPTMERYDRDRDSRGRFTSDDDDRRGGYSSRSSSRDRDEQGRFAGDDDRGRSSRSRYDDEDDRRGSRSTGRDRDDQGRFTSDDDRGRSSRSRYDDDDRRGGSRFSGRERDDQGRFMSDDDRGRYSPRRDDDDRGRGDDRGWYGDSEGHARAAERGWDERRSGRYDDDRRDDRSGGRDRDDDGRFARSGEGGRSGGRRDNDGRGWYGDSEGHARAAELGWEHRGGGSKRSGRGDDDDRRSSRGRGDDDDRGGRGHGGWFGDPRGHSEASRRGWRNRD